MQDEAQIDSVKEEVATPEASQQEAKAQEAQVDDRQDRNWREMRRQNDELRRKTKMQEEMLSQLMTMQQQQQPQAKHEEIQIGDEDFIQGAQLKKMREKDKEDFKRAAREEAERLIRERDQSQFMDKLKRQFSDFDDVVNPETLSLLEETDPDLAQTIADLKDPYKIGLQSYKYIKAAGLVEKAPTKRRVKEVEKRIEENAKTVQTPQAYEKRPMAQAFRLTDADKKKLSEEMYYYASLAGGGY